MPQHQFGKFRPHGWANYFLLSRAKGLRGRGNIRHLLWYSAEEILSGILPMPTKPNSGYYEPVAAVADSHVTPSPLHTGTTRYTHHIPPTTPLQASPSDILPISGGSHSSQKRGLHGPNSPKLVGSWVGRFSDGWGEEFETFSWPRVPFYRKWFHVRMFFFFFTETGFE